MLELNSIISNAQDSRVFIRGLHKISVKSPMQKRSIKLRLPLNLLAILSFITHLIAMSFFPPFNLIFLYDQTLSIDVVFPWRRYFGVFLYSTYYIPWVNYDEHTFNVNMGLFWSIYMYGWTIYSLYESKGSFLFLVCKQNETRFEREG